MMPVQKSQKRHFLEKTPESGLRIKEITTFKMLHFTEIKNVLGTRTVLVSVDRLLHEEGAYPQKITRIARQQLQWVEFLMTHPSDTIMA